MIVKLNQEAIRSIEHILSIGHDAVVRRKKDGVVVLEEERKIKYQACPIVDRKRQ